MIPNPMRTPLTATVCFAAWLTLGKVLLTPFAATPPDPVVTLPIQKPLPGWQTLSSRPLQGSHLSSDRYNRLLTARQDTYRQGQRLLTVTVHYWLNTEGDVARFLQDQMGLDLDRVSLRPIESETGFYYQFTHHGQTHRSGCLNPRGGSTVTPKQFLSNRYRYDWRGDRLFAWSLSHRPLIDNRCLWLHVAIPQTQAGDLPHLWSDLIGNWQNGFSHPSTP